MTAQQFGGFLEAFTSLFRPTVKHAQQARVQRLRQPLPLDTFRIVGKRCRLGIERPATVPNYHPKVTLMLLR
jgi:hypothetical protein